MPSATTQQPPPPHPRKPDPSGALYGELPLSVPRKCKDSPYVTILSRADGVTSYTMRRANDGKDTTVRCKIDTRHEYLLMVGTTLHYDKTNNNEARIRCAYVPLARVIALQQPSDDPDRCMVDHANCDPLDNSSANLHWVTPSFNTLNTRRLASSSGFIGVSKAGKRFKVLVAGVPNGTYDNAETAALIYNLILRLKYGSQLDKAPHLLNKVGPESRSCKVWSHANGVDVYHVDKVFVNVHGTAVIGEAFVELSSAKEAAKGLVAKMQAEKKKKEAAVAKKRKTLTVTQREDGVAYIAVKDKGEDVKIPMDDETWKDIMARDAKLSLNRGRPTIRDDGQMMVLSRWLLNARAHQVVDHINQDRLDHRLVNLRLVDRSANGQNVTRGEGYVGVKFHRYSWRVYVNVKGEYRAACKLFPETELDQALELHDLTALHQHGADALINLPERRADYLKMLAKDATKDRVMSFLTGRREIATPYKHAYRRGDGFTGMIKGPDGERKRLWRGTGAEVRAAIFGDMYRLKFNGSDLTINFEWMRPWYVHHLPQLSFGTELDIVEEAYRLLGGDAFAAEEEARLTPSVDNTDASSSSTVAPALASSSRKRKSLD